MAGLDEMWAKFSLSEEEERGAEVSQQKEVFVHRLAGKFLTKRVLNVEAVARTFKPLWKPVGELKIRDIGDNILLFEFDDALDLERVLEYEPWSFDRNLVVFQRAVDAESALTLDYSSATFWMQIHNIPQDLVTQETGESIGNKLGSVVQVADPEDDGTGGEFLRVRIKIDISRPLPRCCKLWNEGKLVGWVGLRFKRLPNFCYWCGRVGHGERDCELWLSSMGRLRREDQQYGDWLRAEAVRASRKTVTVIVGAARSQAPWAKHKLCQVQGRGSRGGIAEPTSSYSGTDSKLQRECRGEKNNAASKPVAPIIVEGGCGSTSNSESMATSERRVLEEEESVRLDQNIVNLSIGEETNLQVIGRKLSGKDKQVGCGVQSSSLDDKSATSKPTPQTTRGWKRLAREVGSYEHGAKEGCGIDLEGLKNVYGKRGMDMEIDGIYEGKKHCMEGAGQMDDQNSKVVAGSQHHRAQ